MIKSIEYPFTMAKIRDLRAGDKVNISGIIFTGRDRLHKHLFEGGKCPVDLKDGAIYHCGPVMLRKDGAWTACAAGPTTSIRQELYLPKIIEQHKIRVIIGKGGMGPNTMKAFMKHGCVYLQIVGGAAALIAEKVEKTESVHLLNEFGEADALWVFRVKDMNAVVTMDTNGGNLHKKVKSASKRAVQRLMA